MVRSGGLFLLKAMIIISLAHAQWFYSFFNQTTVPRQTAVNESDLQQLGITHILNAAKGTKKFTHVNTNADFYKSGIIFHGIPATDILTYKINKYFKEASNFIESAVGSKEGGKKDGKVYVHCKEGVSRSATLVLAYLVTWQDMNLTDAFWTVKSKRKISPNPGFLQQLIDYATKLDRCR